VRSRNFLQRREDCHRNRKIQSPKQISTILELRGESAEESAGARNFARNSWDLCNRRVTKLMNRMMRRRTRKVTYNEREILPVCGSSQRWIFVRATSGSSCASSFHSDGCFTSDLGSYDGGDDTCGNAWYSSFPYTGNSSCVLARDDSRSVKTPSSKILSGEVLLERTEVVTVSRREKTLNVTSLHGMSSSQEREKTILLCEKAMEQMRATSDKQR
jgi:hypothetical protein